MAPAPLAVPPPVTVEPPAMAPAPLAVPPPVTAEPPPVAPAPPRPAGLPLAAVSFKPVVLPPRAPKLPVPRPMAVPVLAVAPRIERAAYTMQLGELPPAVPSAVDDNDEIIE
jgi:hypothetical protein